MVDSITYRNTDGSRWGAGKDANLTPAQVDINFWVLYGLYTQIVDNPLQPVEITSIRQEGVQIYIEMADSTEFGPFTLPTAVGFAPVTEEGAEIELAATHLGKFILCQYDGGTLITVPGNDTFPAPKGAEVHFRQDFFQSPLMFIEGSSGVEIDVPEGFALETDRLGAVVTLKKVDSNDRWILFGLLAEAAESESDT